MSHRAISSNTLSGFDHLAAQLGATRSEARAHVIEVGFYRKKQVRVLHRNPEQMDLPIDTLELGFERRHL